MSLQLEPALRQFARAVTADQLAGDELARAVLEELSTHNKNEFSSRVEGFRPFIEKWREMATDRSPTELFTNKSLVSGLGPPPAEERLVLLLADVMQFSEADVEQILQPLSASCGDILKKARKEIIERPGRSGRAVVIEDEPLIASDLKDILGGMGVKVVGIARDAASSARVAMEEKPDIVLADYNLDGDETGVDAIVKLQETHDCPVIFITGYPDDVLSGNAVEPDFVLVKPYTSEAVRASVAHCLDTERYSVTE